MIPWHGPLFNGAGRWLAAASGGFFFMAVCVGQKVGKLAAIESQANSQKFKVKTSSKS